MTEREWLRFHLEAAWGITLPPLVGASVELLPDSPLPPWSLYLATWPQEQVTLWAPGMSSAQRARLLNQAQRIGKSFDPASGMRREVVFQPQHPPRQPPAEVLRLTRRLTPADTAMLEAFEPDSASYYLHPQRAPCIGVVVQHTLMSVAHSSRRTREACELGIDTLPDARRKGYALAATVAWTEAIREEGLQPIYSANADNTASLQLAASAGYAALIEGVYGPVDEDDW